MDLDHAVVQIDDPVVGDADTGVEAGLVATIEGEARVGHLDDQRDRRGMRAREVSRVPRDDHQIGLRLRVIVEGDRQLRTNDPAGAERGLQRLERKHDARRVGTALRLAHQQETIDQLEPLGRVEKSALRQPLVFHALEPSQSTSGTGPHHFSDHGTRSRKSGPTNPRRHHSL